VVALAIETDQGHSGFATGIIDPDHNPIPVAGDIAGQSKAGAAPASKYRKQPHAK